MRDGEQWCRAGKVLKGWIKIQISEIFKTKGQRSWKSKEGAAYWILAHKYLQLTGRKTDRDVINCCKGVTAHTLSSQLSSMTTLLVEPTLVIEDFYTKRPQRNTTLSLAVRKRGSSWKASLTSLLNLLNRVSNCSTYFSESWEKSFAFQLLKGKIYETTKYYSKKD